MAILAALAVLVVAVVALALSARDIASAAHSILHHERASRPRADADARSSEHERGETSYR
jgi:hypothetical protein